MGFGPRSKRPCLFTTYSTAGIGDNYPGLIRCGLHPVCAEHFSLNSYLLVAALSDAVSWFPPPSASIRISLMSPGSSLIASPGSVRTISTPVRIVLQYVFFKLPFGSFVTEEIIVADAGRPLLGRTCLHCQTSRRRKSGCKCSPIAVFTPDRPVYSKTTQVGMDVM